MGRSVGTLMSDPKFKEVAYQADSKEALIQGIEAFLASTTVLPPAGWDPTIRLEPPSFEQVRVTDKPMNKA
jgi:hypothetical protein